MLHFCVNHSRKLILENLTNSIIEPEGYCFKYIEKAPRSVHIWSWLIWAEKIVWCELKLIENIFSLCLLIYSFGTYLATNKFSCKCMAKLGGHSISYNIIVIIIIIFSSWIPSFPMIRYPFFCHSSGFHFVPYLGQCFFFVVALVPYFFLFFSFLNSLRETLAG